ncbi:MAG: hypothetical protein NZ700_01770 [Gemmataceae bacterium]|nr:hypothetical protein [Gemmataceae bacterium]MDW8264615.1 hypothetical protein [Gemmataceae bacterium]
MARWLCWGSMAVAGILAVLFVLDLVLATMTLSPYLPFGGVSYTIDVLGTVICALVFYLAWDAWQDIR